MLMTEWITLIQSFGIPVAMLIGLGVGAWKAGRWMGPNVVIPLRDRMIKFYDDLDIRLDRTETQHKAVLEIMKEIATNIHQEIKQLSEGLHQLNVRTQNLTIRTGPSPEDSPVE